MTLKDMKIKTFSLIEEYYPEVSGLAEDEDVKNKINGVVNQIQMDLMKYRKINALFSRQIAAETSKTINIKEDIENCYQIKNIVLTPDGNYSMPDENTIVLEDDYVGLLQVYYYKYPTLVELEPEEPDVNNESESEEQEGESEETTTESYDESFVFDLDPVLLEVMPYGIAADLLKMDMISNYGRYFAERYAEAKNSLDARKSAGMILIDGGVEI